MVPALQKGSLTKPNNTTTKEEDMSACPKCGYERQDQDDEFTPAGECPRCHIVYSKFWQAEMQYRSANAANQNHATPHGKIQRDGKRGRSVAVFICILMVTVASYTAYRYYFSKPNEASKPWGVLYSEASQLFSESHYSEVLPLANLALSKAEQEKKPDQKKILEIMKLVAATYEQLGEHEQCVDSLERLKERQEKTLGPDHQEVIRTMDKLSSAYRRVGNEEKANSLIHEVISINERKTASAVTVTASEGAERPVQSNDNYNAPAFSSERRRQVENRTVYCLNSIYTYSSPLDQKWCSEQCAKKFGTAKIDDYVKDGWHVVLSAPEVYSVPLIAVNGSTGHKLQAASGCQCNATRYVIER